MQPCTVVTNDLLAYTYVAVEIYHMHATETWYKLYVGINWNKSPLFNKLVSKYGLVCILAWDYTPNPTANDSMWSIRKMAYCAYYTTPEKFFGVTRLSVKPGRFQKSQWMCHVTSSTTWWHTRLL